MKINNKFKIKSLYLLIISVIIILSVIIIHLNKIKSEIASSIYIHELKKQSSKLNSNITIKPSINKLSILDIKMSDDIKSLNKEETYKYINDLQKLSLNLQRKYFKGIKNENGVYINEYDFSQEIHNKKYLYEVSNGELDIYSDSENKMIKYHHSSQKIEIIDFNDLYTKKDSEIDKCVIGTRRDSLARNICTNNLADKYKLTKDEVDEISNRKY
ncbi:hypothetical protein [Staphylococcus borealis]|uniref:hypothetical protein n=1 Tax=Staphylococcus borealis TaxID=2742203 RepID=UPI0039EAD25C